MFAKYKWSSTHHLVKQNFMGYHPPSPISNGGWEYHQENTNSEHSKSWSYASEPQDEKGNYMGYFPPPQNAASHDFNGGWKGNSNAPYDIHPKISSLDHASTESLCQNSPPTQTSMNQSLSKLESMLKRFAEEEERYHKELENSLKNMEVKVGQLLNARKEKMEKQECKVPVSSEIAKKEDVVKVVEPETALEVIKEHEHSQPSQTSLESVIEKYEEEMKKAWEDQQTSSIKELLKQMLSVKEEVEEQESEEVIPNSSEAKKYIKEEFMEPPIQEALDEYKTPIITQQPRLGFKEVKATNKSTNSTPRPIASKLNQAMYNRKLAKRKPRQGAIAESSPLLKPFLLTNWKKRKKVKNR
ncbi:hypothetical protein AHAS_Ahas20G0187500 [Arachis hypogaea]